MDRHYTVLSTSRINEELGFHIPSRGNHHPVTLDMPAQYVMTDLKMTPAITIDIHSNLSDANQKMLSQQVRMLLITEQANKIAGIITATDILGEKPVLFMHQNAVAHHDVAVEDLMTKTEDLDVIQMTHVQNACVGDIVETLKRQGRQHAIVTDTTVEGTSVIRGIFSSSQISKQLGAPIDMSSKAHSFAELEHALFA